MKVKARLRLNRTAREVLHYKNLASSPVMGTVHNFTPVTWGRSAGPAEPLPKSAFKPGLDDLPIDVKGLVSYDSSPQ